MHRKMMKRNHRTTKKVRYQDLNRVSGGKKVTKKTTKKMSFSYEDPDLSYPADAEG